MLFNIKILYAVLSSTPAWDTPSPLNPEEARELARRVRTILTAGSTLTILTTIIVGLLVLGGVPTDVVISADIICLVYTAVSALETLGQCLTQLPLTR